MPMGTSILKPMRIISLEKDNKMPAGGVGEEGRTNQRATTCIAMRGKALLCKGEH
jgi:hypothetical protein